MKAMGRSAAVSALLALAGGLLVPSAPLAAQPAQLWHLDGNVIRDESGAAITIRSFAVNLKTIEEIRYDANGQPIVSEANDRILEAWDHRLDWNGLADLEQNGFNAARLIIDYRALMRDNLQDPAGEHWSLLAGRTGAGPTALDDLEKLVDAIGSTGLKVILDTFRLPGGHGTDAGCHGVSPYSHQDWTDEKHFWDAAGHPDLQNDPWAGTTTVTEGNLSIYHATKFQLMTFWLWEQIAAQFADNPNVAAYEPINEPRFYLYKPGDPLQAYDWGSEPEDAMDQMDVWYRVLETKIVNAENAAGATENHIIIRQVPHRYGDRTQPDDQHPRIRADYMLHCRGAGNSLFDHPNVMLGIHIYQRGYQFYPLGSGSVPEIWPAKKNGVVYDRDYVAENLDEDDLLLVYDTQNDANCNRPIWVGEGAGPTGQGDPKDKAGGDVNTRDDIAVMEQYWATPIGGWGSWGAYRVPALGTALTRPDLMGKWKLEWGQVPPARAEYVHSSQGYLNAPENALRPSGIHTPWFFGEPAAIGNLDDPFPEGFGAADMTRAGWTEDLTAPGAGHALWSVQDGWYTVSASGAGASDYASSRAGLNGWSDYRFEGTLQVEAGSSALLLARALTSRDFYALRVGQGSSNNAQVLEIHNGVPEPIGPPASLAIDAATPYRFALRVSGDAAATTIAWDVVPRDAHASPAAAPDPSRHAVTDDGSLAPAIPRGRVGVGLLGPSGTARFDDLNVIEDGEDFTDLTETLLEGNGSSRHRLPVRDRGDFVLDFRVRFDGTPPPGSARMGVRFRAGAGNAYDLEFADFPADVGLSHGVVSDRVYAYLKLFETTGGSRVQVAGDFDGNPKGTPIDLEAGRWYRARIVCRDLLGQGACSVAAYLDDLQTPVLEHLDDTPPPAGGIILYGSPGLAPASVRFDDLRIGRYHGLFEDRFNDSTLGESWSAGPGTWTEGGGYLEGSAPGYGFARVDPDVAGSDTWSDVRATGRFSILDDASDAAHLLLRMEGAGDFYAVEFDAAADAVRVLRFNGGSPTLLADWSRPLDLDTWYDYDVRIQGRDANTKIEVRVGGAWTGIAYETDPTGTLDHERGTAGFGAFGSTARYDDLVLTRDPFVGGDTGDGFDDGKLDGWRVVAGSAEIDEASGVLVCHADDTSYGNSLVLAGDPSDAFYTVEGEATLVDPVPGVEPGFRVLAHFRDALAYYALEGYQTAQSPGDLVVLLYAYTHNGWTHNMRDPFVIHGAGAGPFHFRLRVVPAGADVLLQGWVNTGGVFGEPDIEITDSGADHYILASGFAGLGARVNHQPSVADLEGSVRVEFDNVRIY